MFATLRDHAFPFIKTLGQSASGEGDSTYYMVAQMEMAFDEPWWLPAKTEFRNQAIDIFFATIGLMLLATLGAFVFGPGSTHRSRTLLQWS